MSRHAIPRGGFLFHERNAHHSLKSREIYTVRYDAVNAMLLNEFLKEHRKVQKLEAGMEVLVARLKEQEAQIQKVSAQLELQKPAAQTVANDR